MRAIALVTLAALAAACASKAAPEPAPVPPSAPASVTPSDAASTAQAAPPAPPSPSTTTSARPTSGRIVTGGPVVLPDACGRCVKDADCTFVSLGCCEVTPVARAHAAEASRKLEASGRPFCAPKAACGPGPDGTFAGTAGKCTKGACGCDPAAPLYRNCLGE